jgi:glycosyltransferase involved in cell wall biosynthesis
VEVYHFLIASGGAKGYVKSIFELFRFIKNKQIDIVHVHYGLWGMLAVLTKYIFFNKCKILITYHGSDLFHKHHRQLSLLASKFASHNILVSNKMLHYFKRDYSVIPCGIDTGIELKYRKEYRAWSGWLENDFVILFSSNFKRKVKDPDFAFKIIETFRNETTKNVKFIELAGFSREQLTHVMQAADAIIMCSVSEGSPQVIKEAILNTLPVISNDVGEVKSICSGIDNCFIIDKKIPDYVARLHYLAKSNSRIQNRTPVIEQFCNKLISGKLYTIYNKVLQTS